MKLLNPRILILYRFTLSEQRSIILLCILLVLAHDGGYILKGGDQPLQINASSSIKAGGIRPVYEDGLHPASGGSLLNDGQGAPKKLIEINSADSTLLMSLYGIGPSFAGRIIKYRSLLGGYHTCNQLLEVYGMDSLRYDGFFKRIWADTSLVRKININTAEFRVLLRHPYLDYDAVKCIVQYRDRHGPFESPAELWKDSVLSQDLKQGLYPYLTVR